MFMVLPHKTLTIFGYLPLHLCQYLVKGVVDEIPGLPGQVPVSGDFNEICKFVKSCLNNPELKNR